MNDDELGPETPRDPEQVPLDRLRAADPAAGAEPDETRLRDVIDLRRTEPASLAAARTRRSTRWLQVAAGVVGALAVATAGYGLGRATDADPTLASGPEVRSGPAAGGPASAQAPGRAGDGSSSAGTEAMAGDMAAGGHWGSGRTVFHGQGFSTEAGTAPAWTFDAAGAFTSERAAALAAALGVEGTPELRDGMWTVGPPDGTGPNISLYPDSQVSFSYYDPSHDPYQCIWPEPLPEGASDDERAAWEQEMASEPCQTVDVGPAPAVEDVMADLREVVAAAGLDAGTFDYQDDSWNDDSSTSVSAYELQDGRRTGRVWNMWSSGAGIQSVSGGVAPLSSLGDYPVVSAAEAFDRLTDPRFGPINVIWPTDFGDDVSTMPMEQPYGTPPAAAAPGAPVEWPVEDVTLETVEPGLTQHYTRTGATLLVPTYEFSSADGRIWSVIAVAEASLDLEP